MSLSVVTLEITFLNVGVIRGALALVELPFWKTGAKECFFLGFGDVLCTQKTPMGKQSCPWKWKVHSPAGKNTSVVSG